MARWPVLPFWNCDASRISAGVHFRSFATAELKFSKCFQNLATSWKKTSKSSQISPQTFPKSFQDPLKLDPKGLLEPILEPCLKKAVFWTSRVRAKVAQERPKVAPDRPNPLPNQAQDPPKSDFWVNFWLVFCNSIISLVCSWFFREFYCFFKVPTLKIHAPTQCFVDFYTKSRLKPKVRKIKQKSSQNRGKIREKSRKNQSKSEKNR